MKQAHLNTQTVAYSRDKMTGISKVATNLRVVGHAHATRRVAHTSKNPVVASELGVLTPPNTLEFLL